ncbi:U6 snRNA-associated Sm-like protein LSm2 [Beauveria bassiana]|uniref:U6 snRNA-associated Sm-like protein LSm2 n=1 Tax=Beauveria bassiana TaxID=176275 RepID=A0A2N6NM01_BEABA|nr:U6 snRNA-associated Sm-like protein LSm2 [Beauveria bassiana]
MLFFRGFLAEREAFTYHHLSLQMRNEYWGGFTLEKGLQMLTRDWGGMNSFFKTLIEQEVTVELKNDIQLRGTLKSVDQYLNIKLDDISVMEELKYPHLSSVKNVFIRGSVVRYVHLPASSVDTQLLEDATRREASTQQGKAK